MTTNRDFRDLLFELSAAGADFIIVGAHAVMIHTEPRYTKDLDILIRPTPENARRVYEALRKFGAPLTELTVDDLVRLDTVFQIGIEPNRIDILASIGGLTFDEAWADRIESRYADVPISILGRDALIKNKRAVARKKDLEDVERLLQSAERAKKKGAP